MPEFHAIPDLTAQTNAVSVFDQVPLATMAEAQHKDSCAGTGHSIHIVRGLNHGAQLLPKLDAKQHVNICCSLID